jgi:two-component system, OmpR family, sensor kinase
VLKSLRLRLTAWYLLFFTLLLFTFSGFVYALLARHLAVRLDASLLSQANTAAALFDAELGEWKENVPAAAREAMAEMRPRDAELAVFEGMRLLAASRDATARVLATNVGVIRVRTGPVFQTMDGPRNEGRREVLVPLVRAGREYVVLAAAPLSATNAELHALAHLFCLVLPLVILAAGAGGYLMATRGMAPLVAMAGQTQQITDKNLHERLQVAGAPTELSKLAGSFNGLLERLDQSFETMRRFVADASHELRTPLSVIRGEADVALSKKRSSEEYRESLEVVRDEARRLSRLVDDLLHLARADAGGRTLAVEEFYLNDLLADCCRSLQQAAAKKRIELICLAPADISFRGDQDLLRRLVLNLVDNAIRYTPDGGAVSVTLEQQGLDIRIVVSDTGTGIPPECAEHVFDRFYRVDPARTREQGGFGLGLSIARWIAESHRGTLELSRTSELGSTFTVSLSR